MPTYVYRCLSCDTRLEAVQRMTDDPLSTCESCGGSLQRVLQPVGIVFKGSGFYVTDYKRSEGSTNGKSAEADSAKSTDPGNGKSGDTATKPASTETTPAAPKAEKKEATPAPAAS